jgi:hypothetical protein
MRLIVDIETTSQDRHNAGIVEIAAAWTHHADPFSEAFQIRCRPREDCVIDPDAIAYNGCDWLRAPWAPTESEAITSFARWIYETAPPEVTSLDFSKGQGILMTGWNLAVFDWLILERSWSAFCPAVWPFSFRTLDLHAMAFADMTKRGLHVPVTGLTSSLVCEVYNIPPEPKPHRAMGGVTFETHLYNVLCD